MLPVVWRLYLDGTPADTDKLDAVDEVNVVQQVDAAWEARLTIPVCTDEEGKWSTESVEFLRGFARVRVEVKVGDADFVALIDGPVVGIEDAMSVSPGTSTATVVVHDDSVYLNRDEEIEVFEQRSDKEVAERLLQSADHIASIDVEDTTTPPEGAPTTIQRGTKLHVLRTLAQRQGMHVYVLPGPQPDTSIGAFKKFPTKKDGLPDLVLLGADRTISSFNATYNGQSSSRVQGSTLNVTDKGITAATSQIRDLTILGPQPAQQESNTPTRLMAPGADGAVDPRAGTQAAVAKSAYAYNATGEVLSECYTGVLTPYRVVTVRGVNGRLSGDYVVTRATHRLTRSIYSQSFALVRDAESEGADAAAPGPLGAVF